ncbi:branched-chain amino acid ABC transporter permease [Kineococcus sp. R8]|uniref:branched-chain amino acid ABC transporter permease n=1 Tax=Kineococcus siccus TaxID=2696567 RepID=UPI0014125C6E|nr:branched-chain amino acid ABC transporter permease [Kineococcus siccus]NAZ82196.1 branched-chain amino acid ABC transporter permease [Kineococcus siccus]
MPAFLTAGRLRAAAVAVVAVVLVLLPLVSSPYVNYQVTTMAVFAVALLGLNVVMGYAGQVSLGQSAFVGIGAYVAGYGTLNGWPVLLSFVVACLLPAVVGMLVALAAARLRGLALAMVTIALPIVGTPVAKRLSDVTGGSQGLTVSWLEPPSWVALADDQWRYYVVVLIALGVFLLTRNLVRGRVGRSFAIVRDNEAVALSMGISPYRTKVLAFTLASTIGGASGFLYLAVVQYTSPETLSFGTSINLVVAMVIGGTGSLVGAVLGAVYYVLVPVLAGQLDASRTALLSGAVLLLVLFVLPGGLVSLPRRVHQLLTARRRRSATTPPGAPDGQAGTPALTSDGVAP